MPPTVMKVVASIEARMGSSRLPGKVLADVCGRPALTLLLERLRSCNKIDDIVLATSTSDQDNILEDWGKSEGVAVFRGSEHDVLDRVVRAHEYMNSEIVVEVTGDCPLLDPETIDQGVETFLYNDCDVVTNVKIPSYPQGVDVQVFKLSLLADVAMRITDPAVREHVSLYFYENPREFRVINMIADRSRKGPNIRLQLDYAEDLSLIRKIYERLGPKHGFRFGVQEIIKLLDEEPSLRLINRNCEEKQIR
jgi:spore coat polysaccharide biosynthesis protein SpsF